MGPMGRRRAGRRRLTLAVTVALVLSACTAEPPAEPEPSTSRVALEVSTVAGAGEIDDETRVEMESAVGDVLSEYVVQGFLGDHPRQDFVQAFAAFTPGAAEDAAGDIRQLTAARFEDATAVRATHLEAGLSYVTGRGGPFAATAAIDFRFAATVDGEERPLTLRGRLMLVRERGAWVVCGYDVTTDDATTLPSEASS